MQALKAVIAVHMEVSAAIDEHYYQPLAEGVTSGLDPTTDAPTPTLAKQTRYVRLHGLLTVLHEVVEMENKIMVWYEGLQIRESSVELALEKCLEQVQEASHRIPDDWDTCAEKSGSDLVSVEDIKVQNVKESPSIPLELRINYFRHSLDTILSAIYQFMKDVYNSTVDLGSPSPIEVTPNDIGSLMLKLPQKYLLIYD